MGRRYVDAVPTVASSWSLSVKTSPGEWALVPDRQCLEWLEQSGFCRVYDQIATAPDQVDILDLAIPAFLDAVPNFGQLRPALELDNLDETLSAMSSSLQKIPQGVELWDWDDPRAHEYLTALYRACNLKSYKAARFTKMLHRKRPALLPIIDTYVLSAWRTKKGKWISEDLADLTLRMRDELGEPARMAGLNALKEASLGCEHPWASLSRLRLYDIVSYWYARNSYRT